MKEKDMSYKKVFIPAVLMVILAAVIFLSWLYSGMITSAKMKVFNSLPFPAAIVDTHEITVRDYIARYQLARVFNNLNTHPLDAMAIKGNVLDRLIAEKEIELLNKRYENTVTSGEVEAEFNDLKGNTGLRGQTQLSSLLKQYNLNDKDFKKEVVLPDLQYNKLQIWYNSQESLNQAAYRKANDLLNKAKSGSDFAGLAKAYTEDGQNSLEGDLGFMDVTQVLPELREPLANAKPGDIKLLPSRYGLHIVKVEEQGDNKQHLRQIFIATSGFDGWLKDQQNNFKVKKII